MIDIIELSKKTQKLYTMQYQKKDEKFDMVLHIDTLIKYDLFNRKRLDEKTFKSMREDDHYTQTFMHAINLLAKKPYAKQGLIKALKKPGVNPKTIHKVISDLETLNYINEEKTVDYMVDEMMEFDLIGPNHIKKKLEKEGYEITLINQALIRYNETIELRQCIKLLEKAIKQSKKEPVDKMLFKLKTKAYQKGFDLHIIDQALEHIKEDLVNNTDEETLLIQTIDRLKNRYDVKNPKEKQRLMQKLMRDGFNYSMIKKILD